MLCASVAVLFALLAVALAAPELQFASSYGSHMVLQRAPQWTNIWGFGVPGTTVNLEISINGTAKWNGAATVDGNAPYTWLIQLPPLTGGPYSITAFDQITAVTIIDVLFGDVWFTVNMAFNATDEIAAAANYPQIRMFTVSLIESDNGTTVDLPSVAQYWSVASPDSINGAQWDYFSATCWFFARDLANALGPDVPLGMITSCYSGTNVEAWSSPQSLEQCGWINPPAPEPKPRAKLTEDQGRLYNPDVNPSSLWNDMIYPLLNMTIKGAIWYQGEANVNNPSNYSCTFPAMIGDWRDKWAAASNADPNFPFGFVQLAGYCVCSEPANECDNSIANISIVAPVRWAQTASQGVVPNTDMPNVFMASAVDLPDPTSPECDIHPRSKQEVGRRLSLGALNTVYGFSDLPFQGPYPQAVELSSTTTSNGVEWEASMSFANTGTGLVLYTNNTNAIAFELYWNEANIMLAQLVSANNTGISVSATAPASLGKPVALRHLWRDLPCPNSNPTGGNCLVYNSYDLPATPFYIPFGMS